MKINIERYPDWIVDIDEISMNVYRIFAQGPGGQSFEMLGTDSDELIKKLCKYIEKER